MTAMDTHPFTTITLDADDQQQVEAKLDGYGLTWELEGHTQLSISTRELRYQVSGPPEALAHLGL